MVTAVSAINRTLPIGNKSISFQFFFRSSGQLDAISVTVDGHVIGGHYFRRWMLHVSYVLVAIGCIYLYYAWNLTSWPLRASGIWLLRLYRCGSVECKVVARSSPVEFVCTESQNHPKIKEISWKNLNRVQSSGSQLHWNCTEGINDHSEQFQWKSTALKLHWGH